MKNLNILEAYLDIETTGLSPNYCQITVVGIYILGNGISRFVQLVGDNVNSNNLLMSLHGVKTIYTYNGSRFDLPFIYLCHKVNLAKEFEHSDLMHQCHNRHLYGGLKSVEQQLGIKRQINGINGYDAVRLWWKYINDYDEAALNLLLEYNREDVLNLKCLKDRLF